MRTRVQVLAAAVCTLALGQSVAAAQDVTIFSDNFTTLDTTKWPTRSGLYLNTVYGSADPTNFPTGNAFLFDSATGTSRSVVTQQLGISATAKYARITFKMRYEDRDLGGATFPFEDPDPGEEVNVDYTTNGSTFTNLVVYSSTSSVYRNWATAPTINLPVAALTSTTQIRWRQISHSGTNFDQFAIDDVQIYVNPEPGTWALFGIATVALGAFVVRRRRARASVQSSVRSLGATAS